MRSGCIECCIPAVLTLLLSFLLARDGDLDTYLIERFDI